MDSGVFHETLLASSPPDLWGETKPINDSVPTLMFEALVDKTCLSLDERHGLTSAGYDLANIDPWLAYNLTFDPSTANVSSNSAFPESMLAPGCLFSLPMQGLNERVATRLLEGTVGGQADKIYGINGLTGPQILKSIYNYGNISLERVDNMFHNISNSATRFIRQNSGSKFSIPAKVSSTPWRFTVKVSQLFNLLWHSGYRTAGSDLSICAMDMASLS